MGSGGVQLRALGAVRAVRERGLCRAELRVAQAAETWIQSPRTEDGGTPAPLCPHCLSGPSPVNTPALLCPCSVLGPPQDDGGQEFWGRETLQPACPRALFFSAVQCSLPSWFGLQGQGGAGWAAGPGPQEGLVGHSRGPPAHVFVLEARVGPTRHALKNFPGDLGYPLGLNLD